MESQQTATARASRGPILYEKKSWPKSWKWQNSHCVQQDRKQSLRVASIFHPWQVSKVYLCLAT